MQFYVYFIRENVVLHSFLLVCPFIFLDTLHFFVHIFNAYLITEFRNNIGNQCP
jgi:hypothetical protein